MLVSDYSPDPAAVQRIVQEYLESPATSQLIQLQEAVEPPRQELFRRINMAPGGTTALVRLRQQLLETLPDHPDWAAIEFDLLHLFRSWFNRGFLALRRIDWRAPACILERLIQYEAVHQIQGWADLRRRLDEDRRCYAFFHPALVDEPLIFVEVALSRGLPASVQPLLNPESPVVNPRDADSGIFYSITNCQRGLRGVSFGNLLIKQVVEDLGAEFQALRFATISPVPAFTEWLISLDPIGFSPDLRTVLERLRAGTVTEAGSIPAHLSDEVVKWCAHYLMHIKRGAFPHDRVARFHLANGASVLRINWMGDNSPAGIARSLGITVNYAYELAEVEANHDAYARGGRVAAARSVRELGKGRICA